MNDKNPMDPQRLDGIREMVECCAPVPTAAVTALLVAHDYHEARAGKAERDRDFTRRWYGQRWERLKELLRPTDLWDSAATIMANGTASVTESATYATLLAAANQRAEQGERERDAAKAELAHLRALFDEARSQLNDALREQERDVAETARQERSFLEDFDG